MSGGTTVRAAAEELRAQGASLFARSLTLGRTGNLSVRLGDTMLVTPTGVSLGMLDVDTMAQVDLADGTVVSGRPSKEAFLHAAAYRARPGAGAVVHLHSTYAVAVSVLADTDPTDAIPPLTAYFVMRVGRVPVLPYHAPGDDSLEELALRVAAEHSSFLIANHGSVVTATDLRAAVDAAEELEETAKLHVLLRGQATRPLTPDQVEALERRHPR